MEMKGSKVKEVEDGSKRAQLWKEMLSRVKPRRCSQREDDMVSGVAGILVDWWIVFSQRPSFHHACNLLLPRSCLVTLLGDSTRFRRGGVASHSHGDFGSALDPGISTRPFPLAYPRSHDHSDTISCDRN